MKIKTPLRVPLVTNEQIIIIIIIIIDEPGRFKIKCEKVVFYFFFSRGESFPAMEEAREMFNHADVFRKVHRNIDRRRHYYTIVRWYLL